MSGEKNAAGVVVSDEDCGKFVEHAATIISDRAFPSPRAYEKARRIYDEAVTSLMSKSHGVAGAVKVDDKSQWPEWVTKAVADAFHEGCRQTREPTASAVAQGAVKVPDGYALVPIEPTESMMESGMIAHHEAEVLMINEINGLEGDTYNPIAASSSMRHRKMRASHVYKAMLDAATQEKAS